MNRRSFLRALLAMPAVAVVGSGSAPAADPVARAIATLENARRAYASAPDCVAWFLSLSDAIEGWIEPGRDWELSRIGGQSPSSLNLDAMTARLPADVSPSGWRLTPRSARPACLSSTSPSAMAARIAGTSLAAAPSIVEEPSSDRRTIEMCPREMRSSTAISSGVIAPPS